MVESIVEWLIAIRSTTGSEVTDWPARETAQARLALHKAQIAAFWGEYFFEHNMATVNGLLEQIASESPYARYFIDRAAKYFDPQCIDALRQFAEIREALAPIV